MPVRPDNRLADVPMTSLACRTCGAQVEVRKSSWDQTSIQWHEDAAAACVERRASSARPGPNGGTFAGCSALRETVREAAVSGDLPVVDGDPLKANSAAEPPH